MATSQNGWSANNRNVVSSRTVPGTERKVTVRNGEGGNVLLYVAAVFDKTVEDIDGVRGHYDAEAVRKDATSKIFDDWGYAERPIRGSSTQLSNHASGTAIDLNASQHPLGKVGTFAGIQRTAIQALLKAANKGTGPDVVRWGGNYNGRKDEMHFELITTNDHAIGIALANLKKLYHDITTDPAPKKIDYIKVGSEFLQKALNNETAWIEQGHHAAHFDHASLFTQKFLNNLNTYLKARPDNRGPVYQAFKTGQVMKGQLADRDVVEARSSGRRARDLLGKVA